MASSQTIAGGEADASGARPPEPGRCEPCVAAARAATGDPPFDGPMRAGNRLSVRCANRRAGAAAAEPLRQNWMAVSARSNDDYLERVKAEIRTEAQAARERAPLPRIEPAPRAARSSPQQDGIEHGRLDYAIGELTGADYRAFIDRAFRALLKRAPDDAGGEAQTRLLAAGAAKAEVLGNLRWSPEGRRIGVRVHGLLPRYVLAKSARVPVLGYLLQWGLALAGLPLLLRHQRAADTSIAARFGSVTDAQRDHEARLGDLQRGLADLLAEHDRRSDAIRADIQRMLLRLDELEHRANRAEGRIGSAAQEMIDLRHYVHAANHWITSLQRNLDDLERDAATVRERADAFAASVPESAQQAAARTQRHADWCGLLAARVPAGAAVLDLGSGDGTWLEALGARGFAADGVEANHALVLAAQSRGLRIAEGAAAAVLARCADAGLDAITLSAALLPAEAAATAELLGEALRALKPGGTLLLRIEAEPYRFASAQIDPARAATLLQAAGFVDATSAHGADAAAVLARRPA